MQLTWLFKINFFYGGSHFKIILLCICQWASNAAKATSLSHVKPPTNMTSLTLLERLSIIYIDIIRSEKSQIALSDSINPAVRPLDWLAFSLTKPTWWPQSTCCRLISSSHFTLYAYFIWFNHHFSNIC